LQHVPVFDKGAEIATLASNMSSAAGNSSSTTLEMESIRLEVGRLNNRRNLFLMLTLLCDAVLYFIAFCVFSYAVVVCRRIIIQLLSQLRRDKKRTFAIASVTSRLERYNGRCFSLCIWNIIALFMLISVHLIMLVGLPSIKTAEQCPGRFEAGPCSR
jgi:hypothetical protein